MIERIGEMMATTPHNNRFNVPSILWAALTAIVGDDLDHAQVQNGVGANKMDSAFFHDVYERGFDACTPKMAAAIYRGLRKYSGQLDAQGISFADIPDPASLTQSPAPAKDQATITLLQGALIYRAPKEHAATALVRDLALRQWTGADGTPPWTWRLALDRRNLDGLRAIYRQGSVHFTPEAVAALKALSTAPVASRTRPAPVKSPEPTPAATGAPGASETRAEDRGMVRVAYLVDAQNEIIYGLKSLPANRVLPGYVYRTPQEAQTAADAMNALLLDRIELS